MPNVISISLQFSVADECPVFIVPFKTGHIFLHGTHAEVLAFAHAIKEEVDSHAA